MRRAILASLTIATLGARALAYTPDIGDAPVPCWAIEVRQARPDRVSLLGLLSIPASEVPDLTPGWLPCDLVS